MSDIIILPCWSSRKNAGPKVAYNEASLQKRGFCYLRKYCMEQELARSLWSLYFGKAEYVLFISLGSRKSVAGRVTMQPGLNISHKT